MPAYPCEELHLETSRLCTHRVCCRAKWLCPCTVVFDSVPMRVFLTWKVVLSLGLQLKPAVRNTAFCLFKIWTRALAVAYAFPNEELPCPWLSCVIGPLVLALCSLACAIFSFS